MTLSVKHHELDPGATLLSASIVLSRLSSLVWQICAIAGASSVVLCNDWLLFSLPSFLIISFLMWSHHFMSKTNSCLCQPSWRSFSPSHRAGLKTPWFKQPDFLSSLNFCLGRDNNVDGCSACQAHLSQTLWPSWFHPSVSLSKAWRC